MKTYWCFLAFGLLLASSTNVLAEKAPADSKDCLTASVESLSQAQITHCLSDTSSWAKGQDEPTIQKRLKELKSQAYDLRQATTENQVTFSRGQLAFGITTTLLRLRSTRMDSEPGRSRNYVLGIDKLPMDLGFQFTFRPGISPYRLDTDEGKGFQLISVGGLLSAEVNSRVPGQSEITLGLVVSFFAESVSLGLGFDLYRGIPVRGADGVAGSGTATTGLLGWAWCKQGEMTPENFSLLLTFNLSKIPGALGGAR
jgi:hypothetical protein